MQLSAQDISLFLAVIGTGGVGVFLIAALLKKFLGKHLDDDIHKVVVALSVVAGAIQYFGQIQASLPPVILGVSIASIYGVSQYLYKIVKWATSFSTSVEAKADDPTTVLPVITTPVATTVSAPADEATF